MSKNKPAKKKVVVVTQKKTQPTVSRSRTSTNSAPAREMVFGQETYIWMGIGAALVFIGMLLMTGGAMPNPDVWDENIIYSTRRTLIAPIVIIAGLGVEIYAILKK
ncbi:MAG: hypothetical protein DHS20C18_14470 [Saprospiraceae bacterium]|nr:MAG: hypothetical protein DHS20C18_14470 [Saprospiraceae bacterium]